MIQLICRQEFSGLSRTKAATKFQQRLGCGSRTGEGLPFCANDPATLETLYLLFFRLAQVQEACATSQAQLDSVLHNWLVTVTECTSKQGCGISLLQLDVSGLGDDLSRAASHQACSYIQSSITSAAEDQEKRDSITRFKACAKRSIPALDDRISPADVIASALFGVCRAELIPQLAQSKVFADGVLSTLSAAVLQQRKQTSNLPKKKSVSRLSKQT